MSLADLKNKGGKKPKKQVSVDEFIDDAKAYAVGKSNLGAHNKASAPTRKRNFKNATFTLSPANIEHLNELAASSGLAKSKLIRILIEQAKNDGKFNKNER
ncbi:replication protein RepA [Neiella sp. HB171785]|uniref:Replication protein RepA n=1 Tax=Neiella litorisoli TaxID=2771431 RepID=A0A8J6QIY1_9GAMM|nr:replication protein RepA [Neiella litorisoli]MBD1388991.1 replication protein RepA [Neiella litorisoli]